MNNSKKYLYIGVITLLLVIGVSLAYFGITIIGNNTAKGNKVVTGNLELTYTDTNEISLENAFPGDSFEKTISVKNTGTKEVSYNLVWTELTNEITNDELVIEATCKRLNSNGTEDGTCDSISQTPIKSNLIKKNISIELNITHEYTIKVTFIDTDKSQDYNKNESFIGKLGIEEYELPTSVSFAEDSWETIAELVSAGETGNYNVGDTKIVDMGDYGTHTVRVANMSTPSECLIEGFSQTACGFVVEFADIITTHNMNSPKGTSYPIGTNKGGWPGSEMYNFINDEIYSILPSDLKNIIIDTKTISGYAYEDKENFTSTDKLYLLAPKEIYTDWTDYSNSQYDKAKDLTRTLDYYQKIGITTSNYNSIIKSNGSSTLNWWLRTAYSSINSGFWYVKSNGDIAYSGGAGTNGVSPAFRIG